MAQKKKSPDVRFASFTEDWNDTEFGHLLHITSASRVHKEEWTKIGVPFFRSSDVVSDYNNTENTKAFISLELFERLSSLSGKPKKGDLLITGGGSIGIPYLVKNNDPLYFKDADLLWFKNSSSFDSYFLYYFFSTSRFRKYIKSITHIGTISHYTVEQAKSTPITVPTIEEQFTIGSFLKTLNDLIQFYSSKYSKLKNLKKAMLIKMFPQKGASLPEIRFKGFEGDWELKPLGSIAEFSKGRGLSKDDVSKSGSYPCVLYGHLYTDYGMIINKVNYSTNKKFENTVNSSFGDILIPSSDTTPTGLARATCIEFDNVILGGDINIIRAKEPILGSFLSFNINANREKILPLIKGTTVRHLYNEDLKTVELHIPNNLDEQKKISSYFKDLDKLIFRYKEQLEKLNNTKKACLNLLFVSEA